MEISLENLYVERGYYTVTGSGRFTVTWITSKQHHCTQTLIEHFAHSSTETKLISKTTFLCFV